MQQIYHTNATTNINIREQIQNNFSFSNEELAKRFSISTQTVYKWKKRDFQTDVCSRPKNINYSLSDAEQALLVSIRSAAWFSLDEVWEMLLTKNSEITRSSVYRCFKRNNINTIPKQEKEKLKKLYLLQKKNI